MHFSKDELEQLAKDICPLCAKGVAVRQREDTREWVHDQVLSKLKNGVVQGHGICWANGLRLKYG